ncbi:hypothetical protein OOK13_43100 [Streptomyces sp. NBC_00378]|uniref:hypothetical protein n=1 Tax=unclassified Streptomyces TaxID=2593676 RepID=UPI0022544EB3|nr:MULTISPECIES: hypothetical protein [unclassified Streptomyces]MCX5115118.1 hypothetical protein [Streptomyces sp. NBC_00378]
MDRLLAGKPQHCDGRLPKNNLAQEAGVSPATMFQARVVLADWDAYIDTHGSFTPGEARRDADIDDLRRKLAAAKPEVTELNRQLTAATTVIASLHHDNQMLRTESEAKGASARVWPRHEIEHRRDNPRGQGKGGGRRAGEPQGPRKAHPYEGDPRLQTAADALATAGDTPISRIAAGLAHQHGGSARTWERFLARTRHLH